MLREDKKPDDSCGTETAVERAFARIHSALGHGQYVDALKRREYLHLPGLIDGVEAGLPDLSDVELALGQDALQTSEVVVFSGRKRIDLEQTKIVHRGKIEPQMVANAAILGNTIIFSNLQKRINKAYLFARYLEEWLGDAIQLNIIASFSSKSGLRQHYDDLDTLVFQLSGSKDWFFFGTPVAPGSPRMIELDHDSAVKLTLHPGDFLHLPAGQRHYCEPDGFSVHLTAMSLYAGASELRRRLEASLRENLPLIENAPAILGAENDQLVAAKYRAIMHKLVDQLEIEKIFAQERKRLRIRAQVRLSPRKA